MPALDGLRGIAVLTVVGYHFGAGWLSGGFLGVDAFFVLSGFLITSLLLVEWTRHDRIDFVAFWIRRARRLLPALLLVLAVVAVWSALVLPDDRLGSVRSDGIWTLFYGVNWHFIFSEQSYFDLVSGASPLRHAWSLAIEEQFYLLWPLIFVVAMVAARGRRRVLVAICGGGALASIVVMGLLYTDGDPSRAYYGTDSRAHGLLIGALLAVAITARPTRAAPSRWRLPFSDGPAARWAVALVGVAGAVVMTFMFTTVEDRDAWLYPWGFVLFEVAVVAVVLAVARAGDSLLGRGLAWRPLCWVGAISYGLYLWHWPVLVFLSEGRVRLDGWQLFTLRAVVTLGGAVASYFLLEQPIRHRRWVHGKVGLAAAPLAVVLSLGVIVVGTRDAAPPPDFLVASPNDVVSLETEPVEAAPEESTVVPAPPPSTDAAGPPPPRDVGRILLMGDSVAMSAAQFGLLEYAQASSIGFAAETRPGCGVLGGVVTGPAGEEIPWAEACADGLEEAQQGLARRKSAETVVWMSTWETSNRWYDGVYYEFGTPEADELWLRLIDEARARILHGTDALLVLAQQPPHAEFSENGPADAENVRRMVHLNELFERYAEQHPIDTRVMDLASMVCPGGPPCPETVDEIALRPRDGGHYEAPGAQWLAPRFFDEVNRVAS